MRLTTTTNISVDGVMQGLGGPDEDRSGGFSGDGRILSLQTENDLSKWPFPLLRLARVDQPRVFLLRKI